MEMTADKRKETQCVTVNGARNASHNGSHTEKLDLAYAVLSHTYVRDVNAQ